MKSKHNWFFYAFPYLSFLLLGAILYNISEHNTPIYIIGVIIVSILILILGKQNQEVWDMLELSIAKIKRLERKKKGVN